MSPETQKSDVVATSHSRCIHLTNDIYRELMRKRDEERTVKESENKVKALEKLARKERKEADEERKRKSREELAAPAAEGGKKARMVKVKCSNSSCSEFCFKNDSTYLNTWTACTTQPKKKCKLFFCSANDCVHALHRHREICTDR